MKCFNNVSFQYVRLTPLSAGICWDIDLKKQNLLSFNFKPPAFYFVVQIKDCAKISLLMKCSQKTTWLSYNGKY